MPTFQFYRRGDKLGEFSGANPSQLVSEIEKYKSQTTTPGGSALNSGGGYQLGGSSTTRVENPNPVYPTQDQGEILSLYYFSHFFIVFQLFLFFIKFFQIQK